MSDEAALPTVGQDCRFDQDSLREKAKRLVKYRRFTDRSVDEVCFGSFPVSGMTMPAFTDLMALSEMSDSNDAWMV